MATITYHGPRPELVIAFTIPIVEFMDTEDGTVIVRWKHPSKRGIYSEPRTLYLAAGVPAPADVLMALVIAAPRRRPGPWFTVRLGRGEFGEARARLQHLRQHWPLRDALVADLGIHRQEIEDFYEGERKVLFINGKLAWAPPGWRPF